jgi:predicted transcriptional regulator
MPFQKLCDQCHCCVLQDLEEAIDRGRGQHRPTKSMRGKWVAIKLDTKYVDTIRVRRKRNLNQRRMVFMNSKILQHREDKFI